MTDRDSWVILVLTEWIDTHTEWQFVSYAYGYSNQLVSYALIMRFNMHTTNNHAVIHFICFWWSGIVSFSSWPKLSRLCTPSFCLDRSSLWTKVFSLCSELIKRRAVKLPHCIMVWIDSIRGVIVTYLSRHHCPRHVAVKHHCNWPVCFLCKQISQNFCWAYRLGKPKWTWRNDISEMSIK